jgi:hypothetical protein
MSAQMANVQMKWTEKLGEPLQENRYAFQAALSPEPDEIWKKCFREIVELFNRSSLFEASIHGSHAVVYGPLMAFETKLSVELQAAVSQTNDAYKRHVEQESLEQKQRSIHWAEEEKVREDLRRKFVKG